MQKWRRWISVWLGVLLFGLGVMHPVWAQMDARQEIFVPYIPNYESPATPVPTREVGEPVYGLLGVLLQPPGRRYETYLATADGKLHGLVGESAEVEQSIVGLARGATPIVKVWGELRTGSGESMILVTGILATEAPVAGAGAPVAIVNFAVVSLHSAPDNNAPTVGSVTRNQACNITGRNRAMSWWEITCASGLRGWIDARLVTVQGSVLGVPILDWAVAPPTPAPTPTPRPVITPAAPQFSGWRAEFFANPTLSGNPVEVRDVPEINFNWGSGSPGAGLPADNFSVRFQRRIQVTPGFYRITAEADDGVRVWVDGQLIIDEWRGPTSLVYSVGRVLTGEHDVRVEYYEASGLARVRVAFEVSTQAPEWDASYYPGTSPTGAPVLSRREPRAQNPLDYNWSYSSPAPDLLGTDFWSARWTGTFYFEGGNYVFRAFADDGVRVYLDGLLVIDAWRDGYKEVSNRYLGVGDGNHTVTVEYYDRTGLAIMKLWWVRESAYTGPQ